MASCGTSDFVGWFPIRGLPQGADITVDITYKAGDPPAVVDLTGYTAKLQVRQNYTSPVLLELNSADGTIILSGTSPNIKLKFTKTKTNPMTIYEDMVYDFILTSPAGERTRLFEGTFSLSRKITD